MSTKRTGDRGEALAAAYLEARGYRILAHNYRYGRAEIDLVCAGPVGRAAEQVSPEQVSPEQVSPEQVSPEQASSVHGEPKPRGVVFVEVKTRTGLGFGRPEEAVTEAKRQHIIRAATAYLHERRLENAPVRFDVVSVMLRPGRAPTIRHFENAFHAG